jgi:hypothetical protein
MKWLMPPSTRRSFVLSLLLTPMACLGCGGDNSLASTNGGKMRRKRAEELEKKAELNRKSDANNARSR